MTGQSLILDLCDAQAEADSARAQSEYGGSSSQAVYAPSAGDEGESHYDTTTVLCL